MGFIKVFIEVMFIIASFQSLTASKEEILDEYKGMTPAKRVLKAVFILFLLGLYAGLRPIWPFVAVIFLILPATEGVWMLINEKSYFSIQEKTPEIIHKVVPLTMLLYFGFNLASLLFSFF